VRYRAIFFDAGETLLHPRPSFPELFAQVLEEEGVRPVPGPEAIDTVLVSDRFAAAAKDGELWTTSPERSKRFWLGVYRSFLEGLGVSGRPELAERLYLRFTDLASYELFPDVTVVLPALSDLGITLGIVSNFEAWLTKLLGALGISDLFSVTVISGQEGIEKPDPRIFQLALDRAGVRANESVYVGDNPVFDTGPAEGVGMRGVLLDRRNRHPHHAGTRITTLAGLPAAVGLPG
jgi:putative hydrolase of the HAD superfamily